jgi:hypothetical protein
VEDEHIVIEDVPVQILPAITPLHAEAIANLNLLPIEDVQAPVMKPEYLVVIAAQLGRPKDLARIELLKSETRLDEVLLKDIAQRHGVKLP